MSLFSAIVKSFVKNGGNFASGFVGVPIAGDIVVDAWDNWHKETDERQRKGELENYARQRMDQAVAEALAAVQQEAPQLPANQREAIVQYLSQVPASIRRSLRRPADDTGTTVPAGLSLRSATDMLSFLPPKLPRFKRGDQPLKHSDLELVELLGQGGFGEVWKARHLDRPNLQPVALKFCLDAAAARSLERERDLLDRVANAGKHHGIVQLFYTHLRADPPCLEYECVEGGDLTGVLAELHANGLPTPELVAKIVLDLAGIVAFAHSQSPAIVHRDLKPANILVHRRDNKLAFKIADFGIGGLAAKEAIHKVNTGQTKAFDRQLDTMLGAYTPLYASPQQMRGEPAAPTDDVYSLGVIWYQMITGDVAVGRPGGSRWRNALAQRGMPLEMVELIESCFEDRSADRPADAATLADNLSRLLSPTREPVGSSPQEEQIKVDAAACERYIAEGKNSSAYLTANYRKRLAAWQHYAKQGMAEAQWLYGDCLLEGIGVTKDQVAAARWYRKAAEQGLALAQMSLANRYYRGEGVGKDIVKAIQWYSKASAQGQPTAKNMLKRIREADK